MLETSESLIARALRATDEAKNAGRNRVCVSRPARA
jgi:PleD family two-component response regulator